MKMIANNEIKIKVYTKPVEKLIVFIVSKIRQNKNHHKNST